MAFFSLHFPFVQADCDIRDYGKKVQQLEIGFDETNDKLVKATESLEEKEKHFKEVEADVAALTRRSVFQIKCIRAGYPRVAGYPALPGHP